MMNIYIAVLTLVLLLVSPKMMSVNNILVKDTYEQEFISSIERNYYRYTLRPREVLAKVTFTF